MKWFLLILMAAAAAAIFHFRDELRGKVDESTSTGNANQSDEIVATGEGTSDASAAAGKPSAGSSKGAGSSKPTGPKAGSSHPGEETDAVTKRYPMPKFKTIEEAVGNWNDIPPSAFPRKITVSKAVKIVLPGGIGSSTIPASSTVFALASRSGTLTVGKTNTASARGQINIDDTDFKQVLGKEFDTWKDRQQEIVMKKRVRHRTVLAQTRMASSANRSPNETGLLAHEKELGKKPKQRADGQVPLMISSLQRRDVHEITPDIISSWGPVIREVVDGKAYWTATVEYETVSMFGELNTEAQALMRDGKVLQWVYTGSGESVP